MAEVMTVANHLVRQRPQMTKRLEKVTMLPRKKVRITDNSTNKAAGAKNADGSASAARTPAIMMTLKIRLEKVGNQTKSKLLLQMKQHPLLQMIRPLTTILRFVHARSQVVVILIHPDQTRGFRWS
jgi:hypothetical protein